MQEGAAVSKKEKRAKKLKERKKNSACAPKRSGDPLANISPTEKAALNEIANVVVQRGAPFYLAKAFARAALPAVKSSVTAFTKKLVVLPKTTVEAAKSMLAVGDKQIAKGISHSGFSPACGSGCNFCCQNMKISFCEDEAILIAEAVSKFSESDRSSLLQRVEKFGQTGSGKGAGQCALLGSNGQCSIYNNRPMTCRAYHSTSALMCERKLNGKEESIAENTTLAFPSDSAVLYSYWTTLGVRKSQYVYEMNTFLARILKFQGRLDEWSQGVLVDEKDVASLSPKKPAIRQRKCIPLVLIQPEPDRSESKDGVGLIQGLAKMFRGNK